MFLYLTYHEAEIEPHIMHGINIAHTYNEAQEIAVPPIVFSISLQDCLVCTNCYICFTKQID
jgi:hypothetical protein